LRGYARFEGPSNVFIWAGEDGKRKQLEAGTLGLDMYNMREGLKKAGLRYVDKPEDL
jgi:hypothetical protein